MPKTSFGHVGSTFFTLLVFCFVFLVSVNLVEDLTPIVKRMLDDNVPFFGPVLRGDGVYQIYVKVPTFTYLEIDSANYDESLKAPTTWKEQRARY